LEVTALALCAVITDRKQLKLMALQKGRMQTLPETQTTQSTKIRKSNRTKCIRSSQNESVVSEEESVGEDQNNSSNQPINVELDHPMEYIYDPWEETKVKQLFLPGDASERPKDAIACHIDILMEARTEPEGYTKNIVINTTTVLSWTK
jgi:thioredoxin reductase